MRKILESMVFRLSSLGVILLFSLDGLAESSLRVPYGTDLGFTADQLILHNLSQSQTPECRQKVFEIGGLIDGYFAFAEKPFKGDLPVLSLINDRGREFTDEIKRLLVDELTPKSSCYESLTKTYLVMSIYAGFRDYINRVTLSCGTGHENSKVMGLLLAFAVANDKISVLDAGVRRRLGGVWIEKVPGKKDFLVRGGYACGGVVTYVDIFKSKNKLLNPFDVASVGLHEIGHLIQPDLTDGSLMSRLLQNELSALFLASAFQAEFLKRKKSWVRPYEEYTPLNLLTLSKRPYQFQSDLTRVQKNGPTSQILSRLRGDICSAPAKKELDVPFLEILQLINHAYLKNAASKSDLDFALKQYKSQDPVFRIISPRHMDQAQRIIHVQNLFQNAKESSFCRDVQTAINDGELKSWIGNSCKEDQCEPTGPGSEGVRISTDNIFPCLHTTLP